MRPLTAAQMVGSEDGEGRAVLGCCARGQGSITGSPLLPGARWSLTNSFWPRNDVDMWKRQGFFFPSSTERANNGRFEKESVLGRRLSGEKRRLLI